MNRSFRLSRTRTPSYHLKIRCCCSMLGDMKTSGRAARGARAQKAAFSSSAYKPSSTRVHDMGEDIGFQAEMGDLPEIEDADAGPADAAGAAGAQDQVASPGGPNVSGVVSIPGFVFWAQTQPELVACCSQLLRRRRRRTRRRSRQVTTVRSNASRFRLPALSVALPAQPDRRCCSTIKKARTTPGSARPLLHPAPDQQLQCRATPPVSSTTAA